MHRSIMHSYQRSNTEQFYTSDVSLNRSIVLGSDRKKHHIQITESLLMTEEKAVSLTAEHRRFNQYISFSFK